MFWDRYKHGKNDFLNTDKILKDKRLKKREQTRTSPEKNASIPTVQSRAKVVHPAQNHVGCSAGPLRWGRNNTTLFEICPPFRRNNKSRVSWIFPRCFDQIMHFAKCFSFHFNYGRPSRAATTVLLEAKIHCHRLMFSTEPTYISPALKSEIAKTLGTGRRTCWVNIFLVLINYFIAFYFFVLNPATTIFFSNLISENFYSRELPLCKLNFSVCETFPVFETFKKENVFI